MIGQLYLDPASEVLQSVPRTVTSAEHVEGGVILSRAKSRQTDVYRMSHSRAHPLNWCFVVGLPGFEPGTSASRTQRANQAAPQPVRLPKEAGQPP